MEYETIIGLEVHAQLLTKSKIFCGCSTEFGGAPNTHTCPVCLGMPGVLPVLNRTVVEFAIRMGLAVHCTIAAYSRFARKNYFYPDLPKGYQISQYELPLAEHGWIEIPTVEGSKRVRILRIHMEEDAGKLIHDETKPVSYVDLNRTGVPLIEIVSEPDIRSPQEAASYLKELRDILVYLEICDGNMEEGSFRCDANISLRRRGTEKLGTRTELKNMNSFKAVQKALEFEVRRQRALLEKGEKIVQETRLWDTTRAITVSMRGKEEAHDYRYFPEPDLVPLAVDNDWIEEIRQSLPELPAQKRLRFTQQYGLPEYDAQVLTADKALADFFEECVGRFAKPKTVSNWIMSELIRELHRDKRGIKACPVTADNLAELLELIDSQVISGKIGKAVFEEMVGSGKRAAEIVEDKGLRQVSDESAIAGVIEQVLAENPAEVQAYRGGKHKLLGFFVGQVMRKTKGKANPQLVNEILRRQLGN